MAPKFYSSQHYVLVDSVAKFLRRCGISLNSLDVMCLCNIAKITHYNCAQNYPHLNYHVYPRIFGNICWLSENCWFSENWLLRLAANRSSSTQHCILIFSCWFTAKGSKAPDEKCCRNGAVTKKLKSGSCSWKVMWKLFLLIYTPFWPTVSKSSVQG